MSVQYKIVDTPFLRRKQRSKPQAVADILKLALKRRGLDRNIARYKFFQNWSVIVGDEIAKRAQPEYLKGNILVVKVNGSIWAQELSFQKEVIIKRINKYTGKQIQLSDLHFVTA